MRVVKTLIARDGSEYPGLARVERVVDVPVLTAGADLLTEPGLDGGSGIYYRPAEGLDGLHVPENPGPDDVAEALEYLMVEYLGDFEFVADADRAQALALLLLPFVRDYIPGPTPMHVIIAPDIGSGKTLLAQACLLPGCGLVPATAPTKQEDEWRKRVTSALLGGTSAILLDNMTSLDSGALAAALTTGTWSDRVLGESREVHLPVRNAWVATGNNLALSPEQARRSAPVFLDPGDVRPADRPRGAFRHTDLLGWGQKHRRALVEAALTLVEHLAARRRRVRRGRLRQRAGARRRAEAKPEDPGLVRGVGRRDGRHPRRLRGRRVPGEQGPPHRRSRRRLAGSEGIPGGVVGTIAGGHPLRPGPRHVRRRGAPGPPPGRPL